MEWILIMLTLITGSPGAGKTSNSLWEFLKNPQYADRPKFCTDIPDFDRAKYGIGDFTAIESWQDCPDGSIIFMDEAQRFLRPRTGRVVPDWLGAFETHRHRGFDFVFITQHPSLIDAHVRKLIGRHHHFHKPFGIKNSIRYTWEFCQESPSSYTFKDAIRKSIKTNPEVFKLYKSTELDTHKRQLPWGKISVGLLGVVMVVGGLLYPFLHLSNTKPATAKHDKEIAQSASAKENVTSPLIGIDSPVEGQRVFKPADLLPRAPNLPWTAPYYDQLTQPSDFPRIAACIESKKGCNCYTQQATPVDVDAMTCSGIVKHSTFDNWKSQREREALQTQPLQASFSNQQQAVVGDVRRNDERTNNSAAVDASNQTASNDNPYNSLFTDKSKLFYR